MIRTPADWAVETPPRARGEALQVPDQVIDLGDTPACAGEKRS